MVFWIKTMKYNSDCCDAGVVNNMCMDCQEHCNLIPNTDEYEEEHEMLEDYERNKLEKYEWSIQKISSVNNSIDNIADYNCFINS